MKKYTISVLLFLAPLVVLGQVGANYITAFYPLDGNAGDSSGNGYHGQILGPVATADRYGNSAGALEFDGVNDYVELNNNNPIITGDSFTVAFWVKLHGQGGGQQDQNMAFSQRSNTTAAYNTVANIFLDDGAGEFTYNLRSDDQVSGERIKIPTNTFNYNQWYHIACTYSSIDVAAVYINGDLIAAMPFSQTGNFTGGVDYVSIGRHRYFDTDYGFLNGAMDDLRIYSTALHEQQIDSLYRGLSTGVDDHFGELESVLLFPNITTINSPISISIPGIFQPENGFQIRAYDTQGRLIQAGLLSDHHKLTFETRGVYLIQIWSNAKGRVYNGKVVIQ